MTSCSRYGRQPGLLNRGLRRSPSFCRGVGSNGDNPVTAVRGTEGSCGYAIPDNIEPERGQVPENFSPDGSIVESKDVRHVLHDDVAWSKLANGSGHRAPQNGLGMIEPVSETGRACALAGEAAGDDEDRLGVMSSNCSDIIEDGDSGPPFGEDAASPRVDLAEPSVFESGSAESVSQEADAVE